MTKNPRHTAAVTTTPAPKKKRPPTPTAPPPPKQSRTKDAAALDWAAFSTRLKARREEIDWRQSDVLRKAGVALSSYTPLERGTMAYYPSPRVRRRLAEAIGWSPDSFERILSGGEPVEVRSVEDMRAEALLLRAGAEVAPVDAFGEDVALLQAHDVEAYDDLRKMAKRLAAPYR